MGSTRDISTDTINSAGEVAKIADDTVVTGDIVDGTILAADLATAITPSHVTKFAGEVTWTGGGATLATTVTGVAATDIVLVGFHTIGTEGVTLAVVPTTNTLTFTLNTANTTNDAVVSYNVLRAIA